MHSPKRIPASEVQRLLACAYLGFTFGKPAHVAYYGVIYKFYMLFNADGFFRLYQVSKWAVYACWILCIVLLEN